MEFHGDDFNDLKKIINVFLRYYETTNYSTQIILKKKSKLLLSTQLVIQTFPVFQIPPKYFQKRCFFAHFMFAQK